MAAEVGLPMLWSTVNSRSPLCSSRSSHSSCSTATTSAASTAGRRGRPQLAAAIDLSEADDGAALAAMTARGSSDQSRYVLNNLVRHEHAARVKVEVDARGLRMELQELQDSKCVLARALRERTDQQKKAERDARMQVVVFRAREEERQMTCDELARRLVEAKRIILEPSRPGRPLETQEAGTQGVSEKPSRNDPLDSFRTRLLQLVSVGGTWSSPEEEAAGSDAEQIPLHEECGLEQRDGSAVLEHSQSPSVAHEVQEAASMLVPRSTRPGSGLPLLPPAMDAAEDPSVQPSARSEKSNLLKATNSSSLEVCLGGGPLASEAVAGAGAANLLSLELEQKLLRVQKQRELELEQLEPDGMSQPEEIELLQQELLSVEELQQAVDEPIHLQKEAVEEVRQYLQNELLSNRESLEEKEEHEPEETQEQAEQQVQPEQEQTEVHEQERLDVKQEQEQELQQEQEEEQEQEQEQEQEETRQENWSAQDDHQKETCHDENQAEQESREGNAECDEEEEEVEEEEESPTRKMEQKGLELEQHEKKEESNKDEHEHEHEEHNKQTVEDEEKVELSEGHLSSEKQEALERAHARDGLSVSEPQEQKQPKELKREGADEQEVKAQAEPDESEAEDEESDSESSESESTSSSDDSERESEDAEDDTRVEAVDASAVSQVDNDATQSSRVDFMCSTGFAGQRPGFIFKTDEKGLGYYRDPHSGASAAAETGASAESNSPSEAQAQMSETSLWRLSILGRSSSASSTSPVAEAFAGFDAGFPPRRPPLASTGYGARALAPLPLAAADLSARRRASSESGRSSEESRSGRDAPWHPVELQRRDSFAARMPEPLVSLRARAKECTRTKLRALRHSEPIPPSDPTPEEVTRYGAPPRQPNYRLSSASNGYRAAGDAWEYDKIHSLGPGLLKVKGSKNIVTAKKNVKSSFGVYDTRLAPGARAPVASMAKSQSLPSISMVRSSHLGAPLGAQREAIAMFHGSPQRMLDVR